MDCVNNTINFLQLGCLFKNSQTAFVYVNCMHFAWYTNEVSQHWFKANLLAHSNTNNMNKLLKADHASYAPFKRNLQSHEVGWCTFAPQTRCHVKSLSSRSSTTVDNVLARLRIYNRNYKTCKEIVIKFKGKVYKVKIKSRRTGKGNILSIDQEMKSALPITNI